MSYAARLGGVWDLATGGKGPGPCFSHYIAIAHQDVYTASLYYSVLPCTIALTGAKLIPKVKKYRTALNTMYRPGTSWNESSRPL